jgi:hypothetical protein
MMGKVEVITTGLGLSPVISSRHVLVVEVGVGRVERWVATRIVSQVVGLTGEG